MRLSIAHIEYASTNIIANLRHKIDEKENTALSSSQVTVIKQPYAAGLVAATPSQPVKKRSSRASGGSRRTSSSTAAKLQLATDEAAIKVNEQYDRELDDRTKRILARDAVRAQEDAARAEEDAARAEEEAQRQKRKVEEDLRRKQEDLEEERLERTETTKRQKAIIVAKKEAIDSLDEGSSHETGSVKPEVAELSSDDKVTAYVSSGNFDNISNSVTPIDTAVKAEWPANYNLPTFVSSSNLNSIPSSVALFHTAAKDPPSVQTNRPQLNAITTNLLNTPFRPTETGLDPVPAASAPRVLTSSPLAPHEIVRNRANPVNSVYQFNAAPQSYTQSKFSLPTTKYPLVSDPSTKPKIYSETQKRPNHANTLKKSTRTKSGITRVARPQTPFVSKYLYLLQHSTISMHNNSHLVKSLHLRCHNWMISVVVCQCTLPLQ